MYFIKKLNRSKFSRSMGNGRKGPPEESGSELRNMLRFIYSGQWDLQNLNLFTLPLLLSEEYILQAWHGVPCNKKELLIDFSKHSTRGEVGTVLQAERIGFFVGIFAQIHDFRMFASGALKMWSHRRLFGEVSCHRNNVHENGVRFGLCRNGVNRNIVSYPCVMEI